MLILLVFALTLNQATTTEHICSDHSKDDYYRSYAMTHIHHQMLTDQIRMRAYRNAITPSTFRNKTVIDVGAGTGILSIYAAQAGARKVFAVEASRMAKVANDTVHSLGLENVVEIIHNTIENVWLPEKVDIVLSEWMGYLLVYENMLQSVIYARDKWLKPNGLMVPSVAAIRYQELKPETANYVADIRKGTNHCLAEAKTKQKDMDLVLGVSSSVLQQRLDFDCHSAHEQKLRIEPVNRDIVHFDGIMTTSVDLHTVPRQYHPAFSLHTSFVPHQCPLHGFAISFRASLHQDRENTQLMGEIDTSPYLPETHWKQATALYYPPIECSNSRLNLTLDLTPSEYSDRGVTLITRQWQNNSLIREARNYAF